MIGLGCIESCQNMGSMCVLRSGKVSSASAPIRNVLRAVRRTQCWDVTPGNALRNLVI
jgi:hypothetical protein